MSLLPQPAAQFSAVFADTVYHLRLFIAIAMAVMSVLYFIDTPAPTPARAQEAK